ncbi:MAG: hypothetical protein HYZ46_07415 [Nitrosomonadales bacterium]|nr:hypothetical protein [Nitrosomonadales bacterium]
MVYAKLSRLWHTIQITISIICQTGSLSGIALVPLRTILQANISRKGDVCVRFGREALAVTEAGLGVRHHSEDIEKVWFCHSRENGNDNLFSVSLR